jgi:hypothetical protein
VKKFFATIRASGAVVTTVVCAENTFAVKILHALFGAANIINIPVQI